MAYAILEFFTELSFGHYFTRGTGGLAGAGVATPVSRKVIRYVASWMKAARQNPGIERERHCCGAYNVQERDGETFSGD